MSLKQSTHNPILYCLVTSVSGAWTWPCCFLCCGSGESSLWSLSPHKWVDGTHPGSQEWHVAQWHGLGPQTVLSQSQKQVCVGSPRWRKKQNVNLISISFWSIYKIMPSTSPQQDGLIHTHKHTHTLEYFSQSATKWLFLVLFNTKCVRSHYL